MFTKPYKLKSNNTLKNCDKKQLVQRLLDDFPSANEEKVKEMVPVKSSAICMKVILHNGDTVSVFAVDGVPVVVDTPAGLVPTVCALWKLPDLLPTITIHTPVLPKMLKGAPLYLPGVVIPHCGVGFPMFTNSTLVMCNTQDNIAAAVVGRTLMSSGDMLLKAGGVCLETINVFGDLLCREPKFNRIERPLLGSALFLVCTETTENLAVGINSLSILPSTQSTKEEWPTLKPGLSTASRTPLSHSTSPVPPPTAAICARAAAGAPALPPIDSTDITEGDGDVSVNADTELDIPADMEGLLRWSLLAFIKLEGKSVELPLKTNLLYKNHMFPLCPPDRTLDVKKSSYKKMGKFLEAMQKEGLLEVRELEKGVDAVVALNPAHPAVRGLRLHPPQRAPPTAPAPRADEWDYAPPQVQEMLCVTAHVAQLFPDVKKGSALTPPEVRVALTEYIKSRNLTSTEQKGTVLLDSLLAKIVGKQEQETMKWESLMSAVQSRMTAATALRFADGSCKLTKSRLDPITMQVATRSGNKKVTLVSNLEAYGFVLQPLSTACQRAVGAACGVTRAPGARNDQLMLQGDQTHFVAKLLIEKYGLPKKFVEGADKALKKKK